MSDSDRYVSVKDGGDVLPLSVSGLRALLAEILTMLVARRIGKIEGEITTDTLLDHCARRMPAIFGPLASPVVRGPAIAAIDFAVELIEEAGEPKEGWTWPPDPEWVLPQVRAIIMPLLDTLHMMGASIPGAAEYLDRVWSGRSPGIRPIAGPQDESRARTEFFTIPDDPRPVQLAVRRHGPYVYIGERFRGDASFKRIGKIHAACIKPLRRLLRFLERTHDSRV